MKEAPTQKPINVNRISKKFIERFELADRLLYVKETISLYIYNEKLGFYELSKKEILHYDIFNFIDDNFKISRANDESLARTITYQMGMHAKTRLEFLDSPYITFNDGVLNTKTFELEEKSKATFSVFNIDCKYEETKQQSQDWNDFLRSSIVKEDKKTFDEKLCMTLQEMAGWLLLDNIEPHKAFFLIGDGRNGKGVFTKVMTDILGQPNTTHMSLEVLSKNPFATAGLVGKKVNICSEEESKYIGSDLFKSLVAGDRITAQQKYQPQFDFTPRTKFLFTTNQIPRFSSADKSIVERLVFIPFNRFFTSEERIPNLEAKLLKNKPAIVGWALAGAKRLLSNNLIFTISSQSKKTMGQFEETASSVIHFLRDIYSIPPPPTREQPLLNFIATTDLFKTYKDWCGEEGRKPVSRRKFTIELSAQIGEPVRRTIYDGSSSKKRTGWFLKCEKDIFLC